MKDFLKKIKLVADLTTEIEIQKSEFINKFKHHVDEGDVGPFLGGLDIFSSSKNEYKGHVGFDKFKIKRRRRIFDTNMNFAVASGTYRQRENRLIIETEINGFSGMMIPFYILITVFYSIFIVGFFMAENTSDSDFFFAGPFIFIHALFMFGIPYFIMRRSTQRLKYELEREFHYISRK